MKFIYAVLLDIHYEGSDLQGIYTSLKLARKHVRTSDLAMGEDMHIEKWKLGEPDVYNFIKNDDPVMHVKKKPKRYKITKKKTKIAAWGPRSSLAVTV